MYSRAQLSEISENASPSTSGAWKNSAAIVANSARVMCSCGPNLPSGKPARMPAFVSVAT